VNERIEEHSNNVLNLYGQFNAPSASADMVKDLILQVAHADLRVVVRFATAEGAKPIVLPWHSVRGHLMGSMGPCARLIARKGLCYDPSIHV